MSENSADLSVKLTYSAQQSHCISPPFTYVVCACVKEKDKNTHYKKQKELNETTKPTKCINMSKKEKIAAK